MIWEPEPPKRKGNWVVIARPGPRLIEALGSPLGIGRVDVNPRSQAFIVPRRRKWVAAQRWMDEHTRLIVDIALGEWTLPTETTELIPRGDPSGEWVDIELVAPPWDISGSDGPPRGGRVLY